MANEDATGKEPDPANAAERADRLRDAIGVSAGLVRSLFLTFLLLGAYIGVTIGSTTDEQLLRVSAVTLPILDVDLPIIAFYALVPWLLVLFHFNLLLQLYLLARQLHLFNAAVAAIADARERAEQRARLFPFPFVQMIAGPDGSRTARFLFGVLVWVTVVWIPLLLIASAQVRFLPYHDPLITNWIRLAVVADVVLLWVFWGFIVSAGDHPAADWWRSVGRAPAVWVGRVRCLGRRQAGAERADPPPRDVPGPQAHGFAALLFSTGLVLGFSLLVAVVPGEPAEKWVAWVLPAPEDETIGRAQGNLLTYWAFDGPDAPLHRNLQLADRVLLAEAIEPELLRDLIGNESKAHADALARVSGIDLSGRDLRYANLHRAILPRADLRGANLDGADLRRANLTLADVRPLEVRNTEGCVEPAQRAQLESNREIKRAGGQYIAAAPLVCRASLQDGARLGEARLNDASLNMALLDGIDLRHADLARANLAGASLRRARLDNARMSEAQLPFGDLTDANLTQTTLDNADMRRVTLSGAQLRETKFPGARVSATQSQNLTVVRPDLTRALMASMDLRGADLQQGEFARFYKSDLRGAAMAGGHFKGADFSNSDLRNADLSKADLRGADFHGADLSGAILRQAKLDLSQFIRMAACRADMSHTSLTGAHFEGVALRGATLNGANLTLATLVQVDASTIDLRSANFTASNLYGLQVDHGDLRTIAGDPTQGTTVPGLLSLARELGANAIDLSRRQQEALAALQREAPLRDTLHRTAAFTRKGPVLCDETTATIAGPNLARCMRADALERYVETSSAAACADADILAGLVHRLEEPPPLVFNRANEVIGRPPADPYSRMLARALASRECPALGSLPDRHRQRIVAILERSELEVPADLKDQSPDRDLLPGTPTCQYKP